MNDKNNDDTLKVNKTESYKHKALNIRSMFSYFFIFLIILAIIALLALQILHGNKITDEDWDYMISTIENEYGNNEKFHIVSKDIYFEHDTRTHSDYEDIKNIGIRVFIYGYFDSSNYMSSFTFYKYDKDYLGYKAREVTLFRIGSGETNNLKIDYFNSLKK